MASESRRTDPSVEELLFAEGFRFEFFQAVRLLEKVFPERAPVGRDARPGEEVVRFHAHNTLTFPASSIDELSRSDEGAPASMVVAFMGLTGPSGVLPRHYTELVLEEERRRERGLAAFFDVFNHRVVSLFYRAWQKYRVPIAHEQANRPGAAPDPRVLSYEVWSLVPANAFCDVTRVMPLCERALLRYVTPMKVEDYVHLCQDRGYYHACTLAGRPGFVEAFLDVPARDYVRLARAMEAESADVTG